MSGAEILLEPGVIPRLLQGLWVTVWIAGVVRKRGGKLVGIDMPALKRRMNEASARINALGATVKLV